MKLLLTGGTGFFGKALLRHWAAQYLPKWPRRLPKSRSLSRAPGKFLERFPGVSPAGPGCVSTRATSPQPDTLPARGTFTDILHAAADSTYGARLAPVERYDQIVDGTRHPSSTTR